MQQPSRQEEGPVARAVREALETLAARQTCEGILRRSLKASGLRQVPEGGPALQEWVRSSLHYEIASSIGDDAADLLLVQLAPIVHQALYSSMVAPRTQRGRRPAMLIEPPGVPTDDAFNDDQTIRERVPRESTELVARKPARPEQRTSRPIPLLEEDDREPTTDRFDARARPQLLIATMDIQQVSELRSVMGPRVSVRHISDLGALLDAMDDAGLRRSVLVVDCVEPTVHSASVAALAEDMPTTTAVVLWGEDQQPWPTSDVPETDDGRWTRVNASAQLSDVCALCKELLG